MFRGWSGHLVVHLYGPSHRVVTVFQSSVTAVIKLYSVNLCSGGFTSETQNGPIEVGLICSKNRSEKAHGKDADTPVSDWQDLTAVSPAGASGSGATRWLPSVLMVGPLCPYSGV